MSWKNVHRVSRGPFFLSQISSLHTVGKSWLFPPWKLSEVMLYCRKSSYRVSRYTFASARVVNGLPTPSCHPVYICRYYDTVILLAHTRYARSGSYIIHLCRLCFVFHLYPEIASVLSWRNVRCLLAKSYSLFLVKRHMCIYDNFTLPKSLPVLAIMYYAYCRAVDASTS